MTEHLSQSQIDDYRRRKLNPIELLSVSDHLAVCDLCRRLIEAASNDDSAFFALRSDILGESSDVTHASVEQTAAYVDGSLTGEDLQTVSDHLHRCDQCTRAIDDLRAFKAQIGNQINIQYSPALSSSAPEKRRRLRFFLPSFTLKYPALAIGTALTLLLVAMTGWLLLRSAKKEPVSRDIAVSTPPTQQEQPTDQVPIVAQLNDAEGHVTLNQAGQLSGVEQLPAEYQNIVRDALANQRIEPSPSLKGLVRASSPLMTTDKDGVKFSVIEPVGKMLLTDRPTLHWSALSGASGYVVEIYDAQLNLVIASPQLTTYTWTTQRSLARGRIYSWQVKAITDDKTVVAPRPPAPQAKFRIVDNPTAIEIAEARRSYGSSHLLLGMLYAKAGLLDEARQEFRELLKANPESDIVRKLLASLPSAPR